MHVRTTLRSLVVVALALHVVDGCLPATNPWDPDTDPSLQVPATIRGSFSYPDRSTFEGIAVEVASLPELPPVATATTADANEGAYAISVQPGTYWVRAQATGYAKLVIGPLTVRAGERLDLGRRTLDFAPANASIAGTVSTGGLLSPRGVKVTAAPLIGASSCAAPVGEAVTDEEGAYVIEGLRPGAYVVVAFVEGATVALSPAITLFENMQGSADLAITDAASAVILRDPLSGSEEFTRESAVRVVVDESFGWATEMSMSEDPTFATGTGWQTFNTDSIFPPQGALLGLTRTVVYAKFRSPCATSPLYSASIVYDDEAPVLFTARLEGVDGLAYADGLDETATDPPLVVVPDTRQTLLLAIDAIDATGVRVDVVLVDDEGGETPVAVFADVPSVDGLALVRHTVPIPVEEGLSRLRVDVGDIAGNVRTSTRGLAFRVLRDLKAPTAPLPAVTNMTVAGDIAFIWLTSRTCENEDGTTTVALVCEENPKDEKFFEVRGGPAFFDFVGFDNPPFAVPVHKDGTTNIEIRAVDEAGNVSASVGTVVVTHVARRTLQTLPDDRVFMEGGDGTKLASLGPTALYEVARRPGALTGTQFSVVVAQPADRANVGLDPATSVISSSLRRISWGCATAPELCNIASNRQVGPLAGDVGAFGWLEYSGDQSPAFPFERRSRVFRSRPNGDGRHEIATLTTTLGVTPVVDPEDVPSQNKETCQTRGKMDCAVTDAWNALTQRAPLHLKLGTDDVLISGSSSKPVPLGVGASAPLTEEVTGPALIGVQLNVQAVARLSGVELALDVGAGQVLRTAAFRRTSAGAAWTAAPTSPNVDAARLGVVTRGDGLETFHVVDDFQVGTNSQHSMLVGAIVPAGVTVTLSKRPAPVDDGVYSIDDPYRIDGLVVHALADAEPDSFAAGTIVPRATEHPVGAVLIHDSDFLGTGTVTGVQRLSLADDGSVRSLLEPALSLDAATSTEHRAVVRSPRDVSVTHVADVAASALEVPPTCVTLVEVKDQVTLRDVRLGGAGFLDELYLRTFRSETGDTAGLYAPAPVFVDNFGPTSAFPFDIDDDTDCRENVLATISTQHFSGTVTREILSSTTTQESGAPTLWNGVAPINTVGPAQILPFTADIVGYELYLSGGVPDGDADLYAEYGGGPTFATADYWSENIGNNEYIHAPNIGAGDLHVGVAGWQELSGYFATAVPLVVVDTVDLPAGASIRVELQGSGDADLYLRAGGGLTFYDVDCYSIAAGTSNESCSLSTDVATTVQIGIAYYSAATVDVTVDIVDSVEPIAVAALPMGSANSYVVTHHDAATSSLYVGHDAAPTTQNYECYTTTFGGECAPSTNEVPVDAATIHIAILPDADSADYDFTVELVEVGCTEVVAERDAVGSYAESTYEPGIYAFVLGSGTSVSTALNWPGDDVEVWRGPRVESTGVVRVLGAPTQFLIDQGKLVVGGVSSSAPICDMELTFDARVLYSRVAAVDDTTIALSRLTTVTGASGSTLVRSGGPAETTPSALSAWVSFGDDRRPWELDVAHGHALWLETTSSNVQPELRAFALDDSTTEPCSVLDLATVAAPLEVTAASTRDGRVLVGGVSSTGGVVHVLEILPPVDAGACPRAEIKVTHSVVGSPRAVSGDERDTFVIIEDGDSSRLLHFDAREVVPLHAGGDLDAVGFDVDGDAAVLALGPAYGAGDGVLLFVDGATGAAPIAREIVRVPRLTLHPTLVDEGVVALVVDEAGAVRLDAYPRAAHFGSPVTAADVVLASAPAVPANDPRLLTRTPMLAADGSTLAVLGYDGGGRSLLLLDVEITETDGVLDVVTSSLFGPVDVPSFPSMLQVDGDVVVVTYTDAPSVVVRRDAGGDFAVDDDAITDSERVVGVSQGALVVLHDPGPLFVQKPPTTLALELRGEATSIEAALAAETYFHDFMSVGSLSSGDALLYDASATPGLLWQVGRSGKTFIPADGPHRPLLVGTEGIGVSAAPKVAGEHVFYVRRGAAGNALYRMRL